MSLQALFFCYKFVWSLVRGEHITMFNSQVIFYMIFIQGKASFYQVCNIEDYD